MSVDKDTVRRIAKLARIALDEDRAAAMVAELNGILSWVEQLKEVDVGQIPPLTSIVAHKLKRRDDVISDGNNADSLMTNAPLSEDGYFVVPKVVE